MHAHLTIIRGSALVTLVLLVLFAPMLAPDHADARRVRGTTRTSVHCGRSVQVERDLDIDEQHRGYPVATTAAIVGSIVHLLPPACTTIESVGMTYEQCAGVYYRPRYEGILVTYVIVKAP